MENMMKYNDFVGTVQYSAEDRVFYGKLELITDLVTYEGISVDELEASFKEAVEEYVEFCKEVGKEPEKNFGGSFNVRMKPELHRRAAFASLEKGLSLNQLVVDALTKYVGQ